MSVTASNWLISPLVGAEAPASGGRESVLDHSWPLPPWVTLLVLILAGAYVVMMYLREGGVATRRLRLKLLLLRLALVGIVVFMMFGFILRAYRTDLPTLVVLVDDSASMSIEDHYPDARARTAMTQRMARARFKSPQRIDLAKTLLLEDNGQLLETLRQNYRLKLQWLSTSERLEADDSAALDRLIRDQRATHKTSPLGDRVRRLLDAERGHPTAAVILLSDGVTTEGNSLGDVAGYARRRGVPLFLVGFGSDRPAQDVQLHDLVVDDPVYVDDLANFQFTVTATGYAGTEMEARLREDGKDQALAQTRVKLGQDGQPVPVSIEYRPPREGDFEFVVQVDALEGEANSDNNRLQSRVRVTDEKIKVLLVQAYPSYEFRYLKNLLGRSRADAEGSAEGPIELTTVLQEADREYADTDATARAVFPMRIDELLQYDVVIFGDVNPALLTHAVMETLVDSVVKHGRAVVFISGPRYTPLAYRDTPLVRLMPVDLDSAIAPRLDEALSDSFVPRLTQLGHQSPHMQLAQTHQENAALWQNLPGMYWLLEAGNVKPAARVLAEHPERTGAGGQPLPVICLQYVGAGKVLFHASDETWRWRLRRGDSVFGRYWIQTLRFLSRSKLSGTRAAELAADRTQYQHGEPVRFRLRFFDDRQAPPADDGAAVVLESQGHTSRRLGLERNTLARGIFEGSIENLPDGHYHAWLVTPTLEGSPPFFDFTIAASEREMSRLTADFADMKRAADESQGRFYTFQSAPDLAGDLPAGRQVRIESLEPQPIWNSWIVALVFVGLIVTEWLLRNRAGLP
jgi:hypothetical protein